MKRIRGRRGTSLLLLIVAGLCAYGGLRIRVLDADAANTRVLAPAADASRMVQGATSRGGKPELFPAFKGGVPVLLYHRLNPRNDGYSVAPAVFEAQLERLHTLGFQAITLDRYMRFMRGEKVNLPRRPIVITFDDGYVSSWTDADSVLARYGWTAVLYVPTGFVGRPGHLTWEQLRQMRASGRWQIEEHAGDGHVLVTKDPAGRQGSFYANELWADGRQETFAHYKLRVGYDIEHGAAMLAQYLPGWSSSGTFAVPYNNYGGRGSNDRRIEPWLSSYLKAHFAVNFVQNGDSFTVPRLGFANRITVSSALDPDTLENHLLRGLNRLLARA